MAATEPHGWSALIIHVAAGANNLVQLLGRQGYHLADQWEGPAAWRPAGPNPPDPVHLDFTRTSQSAAVLFLQTFAEVRSPVVVIAEVPSEPGPTSEGGPGRCYLLHRAVNLPEVGATTLMPEEPAGAGASAVDERLRRELRAHAWTQLACGLAHDAGNFLTVIGSSLDLLRHEPMSAKARAYVEEINAANDRAGALLRQMTRLCRRSYQAPRLFDLNQMVTSMSRLITRLLGEEAALDLRLDQRPCLIKADPQQLEQVLLNLAVNARDAMTGPGTLTIATSTLPATYSDSPLSLDQPKRSVRLIVRDTGCGMTAAIKAHLFEPFFSTKEPGHGTGIGLATANRVVKLFGGRISVESEPGAGTTFTLDFPEAAARPLGSA